MKSHTPQDILNLLTPLVPISTGMKKSSEASIQARAVLFDVYGTLLVSGTGDISLASPGGESRTIRENLELSGFPTSYEGIGEVVSPLMDSLIRQHHATLSKQGIDYPEVDIREIWRQIVLTLSEEGYLDDEEVNGDVDTLALRHELAVNPVWPMPGFPEIIQELRAGGVKVGIVSNAQFYTPLILEALSGESLEQTGFDPKLCAWSWKLGRAKPSPRMFDGPIAELEADGIERGEILFVGNDMLNDVTAASQAGCRTCLFGGDSRSLRLREGDSRVRINPDITVTTLTQITESIFKGVRHGR